VVLVLGSMSKRFGVIMGRVGRVKERAWGLETIWWVMISVLRGV